MKVKHICKWCGEEFCKDEKSKTVYCSGACRYDAVRTEKQIYNAQRYARIKLCRNKLDA